MRYEKGDYVRVSTDKMRENGLGPNDNFNRGEIFGGHIEEILGEESLYEDHYRGDIGESEDSRKNWTGPSNCS